MYETIYSRRKFIKTLSIGVSSLLLLPRCTFGKASAWRFFTNEESVLVDAIVEQIIPTDEWPGAKDALVTNFIDKQLAGSYIRHQEIYRKSLSAIQTACKIDFGKRFEELAWNEQTDFLKNLERNEIVPKITQQSGNQFSDADNALMKDWLKSSFFNLIRDHTMQGFYGSPRHGGNYKFVSYRMIGLDPYPIMGQNRYKASSNG